MKNKFWGVSLISAGLFVIDRIARELAFRAGAKELIPGFAENLPTVNAGVALGLTLPTGYRGVLILSFILLGVVVALAYRFFKQRQFWPWLGLNLIFFGAFSNFLDRLWFGGVRDFLKFSFWFTTNNLGDLLVTAGAIILIFTYKLKENERSK
ncbi:signal peptidase II [Candidatus Parcubacteria bacterium]|jgi:lipoprotein signal peptidase|nr:MAG: signal peptidase II [Candidatus Parcubacteria bacterium]